jgi:uncharacterized protein YecT (DUF1311 family)
MLEKVEHPRLGQRSRTTLEGLDVRSHDRYVRLILAALLIGGLVALTAQAGGVLKPPVIREPFTPLPCPVHPKTTLAMEGCFEKSILHSDRAINAQSRTVFGLLLPPARSRFVQSEGLWLRYRRSSCLTEASRYQGGSFQPVSFANCEVSRNQSHLKDLGEIRRTLSFH